MRIALLLGWILGACTCSRDPFSGSLSSNVSDAFAACNEAELKFLAAKHNVQLAFAPCGSNKFAAYRWSPDGLRIYFQLVLSSFVMDADAPNRRTVDLPVPTPVGSAAWLSSTRLAIPVGAAEGGEALRMALHEVPMMRPDTDDAPIGAFASSLQLIDLPGFVRVDQVARGDSPGEVLFAARTTEDGPWSLQHLDTADGAITPAFPGVATDFDSFTYQPVLNLLVLGNAESVRVIDTTTGEVQHRFDHAHRGSVDASGRWLALEHLDTPISVFNQRGWDEISEGARRREQARVEAFAERLPEGMDRTVRPPTLSLVDLTTEERWTITSVQGDKFSWYGPVDGWGSFFLWGFEGKQAKRNVALWSLGAHLRAIADGTPRFGLERFTAPSDTPVVQPDEE